jgi:hypothetical protein
MENEIPAIIREHPEGRTAHIAHKGDEDPIGAAMFFTPEELHDIGVNPATTEAVELCIEDGEVQLISIVLEEE